MEIPSNFESHSWNQWRKSPPQKKKCKSITVWPKDPKTGQNSELPQPLPCILHIWLCNHFLLLSGKVQTWTRPPPPLFLSNSKGPLQNIYHVLIISFTVYIYIIYIEIIYIYTYIYHIIYDYHCIVSLLFIQSYTSIPSPYYQVNLFKKQEDLIQRLCTPWAAYSLSPICG